MRCPHCSTIVAESATGCWLCKRPFAEDAVPSPEMAAVGAPPGTTAGVAAPPGPGGQSGQTGPWIPPAPGTWIPPVASPGGSGKGRVLAVVGLLVVALLAFATLGAVTKLGKSNDHPEARTTSDFCERIPGCQQARSSAGGSTSAPYTSTEGHFSVNFPGEPKHTVEPDTVDGVTLHADGWEVVTDSASFAVKTEPFPFGNVNAARVGAFFDAWATTSARNLGGTVVSNVHTTFGLAPGTEFTLRGTVSGIGIWVHGRALLVSQRFYVVVMMTPTENPSEWPAFRDSFKVTA
ncbi:MAG: hypothetical protein U0V73_00350 [Acidimicrobiia bacterium]